MSKILGPFVLVAAMAFASAAMAAPSPNGGTQAMIAGTSNAMSTAPQSCAAVQRAVWQPAGTHTRQALNISAYSYNRPDFAPGD